MRPSELAGLREEMDIREELIHVQNSIVRGREKNALKTPSSKRTIPITPKIREVIDDQVEVKNKLGIDSPYLFINSIGNPFNIDHFRDYPWTSALKRAKVPYRKPYTMRHTFAAWMLLVGKAPGEVARLMGHSSKQMVYEVYGKFVEGLESEKKEIEAYLGIRDGQPFQGDEGHE
jgi:integrase